LDLGKDLEDSVLAAVFRRWTEGDQEAGGEFLSFFFAEHLGAKHSTSLPASLRHLFDSEDLLQSVAADLWPDLGALSFESRGQFAALLLKRLRWKLLDKRKLLQRGKRREDLREDVADLPSVASRERSPATEAGMRDEATRLTLAISRLRERDRALLRGALGGRPLEDTAHDLGLTPEAARKALQRAKERLRSLLT